MTSTSPQSFAEDDDYTINSESTEGTTNIKERREFSEQISETELGPPASAAESIADDSLDWRSASNTQETTTKSPGSLGASSRSGFTEDTAGTESRFSGLSREDSGRSAGSLSQIAPSSNVEKPTSTADQFNSSGLTGMTDPTNLSDSEGTISRASAAELLRSNSGRTFGSRSTTQTENITAAQRRLSDASGLTQNITNARPTLAGAREESVKSLATSLAGSTADESQASSALVPYDLAAANTGGADGDVGQLPYSNYAPADEDAETDDGGDTFNSNLMMEDAARRARRMHTPLEVGYDDATIGCSTLGHGTLGEGTSTYAGASVSIGPGKSVGSDGSTLGPLNEAEAGALVTTRAALPPGIMGPTIAPSVVDASTIAGSTFDYTANSNRSAGWSQYDGPGQSTGTMDTNAEFFERALPPSTTNSAGSYPQQQPGGQPADAATMGGPSTFGGSGMGASNVSAGWSRYDDDGNTLDTMDTNAEFFERALPPSESSGAQFGVGAAGAGAGAGAGMGSASTMAGSAMSGTMNSTQSQGWSRYDDDGNTIETMNTNADFFERALPYQPGDGMSQVDGQYDKQSPQDPGSIAATGVAPSQMMGEDDPSHYSGQSRSSKQSSYHTQKTVPTSSAASVTASVAASVTDGSVSTGIGSNSQMDAGSRSHRGSSLTYTESRSGSEGTFQSTGILYRQAPNKLSAAAREVEVSMDGFLHQNKISDEKSIGTTAYSTFYEEYFYEEDEEDGGKKKFSIKQACTYFPILVMVGCSLFFASQIGPFYIVPTRLGPMASEGINIKNKNGTGFLMDQDNGMAPIPDNLDVAFVNWRMFFDPSKSRDMPVLWNYAMSGGTVVSHVFGFCLGRVQAGMRSEFDPSGTFDEAFAAGGLRIVKSGDKMIGDKNLGGQLFVNVDMGTPAGVMRAIQFALPSAFVSDVISTPVLHPVASLFQPQQGRVKAESQGRLMIVFRDPMSRALNRYEEIKKLDPNLEQLTLEEYVTSAVFKENNPLIRAIVGLNPNDPLGDEELKVAQSFISQKVLVGLYDEMQPTLALWEQYFGWYVGDTILPVQACHDMVEEVVKAESFGVSRNYAATDPDAFNLLLASNRMDRIIFDFAKTLFWKQKAIIEKVLKQKANEAAGL